MVDDEGEEQVAFLSLAVANVASCLEFGGRSHSHARREGGIFPRYIVHLRFMKFWRDPLPLPLAAQEGQYSPK